MGGEWREVTLTQLGRIVTGKTPLSRYPEYFGGDIPFVTPTDFDGRRRIESTQRCLTEQGAIAVHHARLPSEAIMVSCIGSDMGKSAIAANRCVTNQQINSIIVDSDNDPLFVYYNLSNRKEEIRASAAGSAQPILNKSAFGQIGMLLPPLPAQRAIAHILGTLDDKIELNRRMNKTLEEMARALFKSWFVDFDPVRAKMGGRWRPGESLPGLPAEHYDLFPDRLVPSELWDVPEGWEIVPLSECIDVARGLSYKGSGLSNHGMPMHNLNSIFEGGGYKNEGIKYYDGEYKSRHVVRPGDVIVANTEQGHDRLLIGYAAMVPARYGDSGLFSHHLYRVRPKSASYFTSDFICHLLNTQSMQDVLSGYATGTTVNMLPVDALGITPVVMPSRQIVTAFDSLASAARKRWEGLVGESQALTSTRDTLLPKLVSGEIRVAEAINRGESK